MQPASRWWTYCRLLVGVLIVATFTPLVIPFQTHEPALLGMPYTLWVGILVTLLIVILTWLGTKVHPGKNE